MATVEIAFNGIVRVYEADAREQAVDVCVIQTGGNGSSAAIGIAYLDDDLEQDGVQPLTGSYAGLAGLGLADACRALREYGFESLKVNGTTVWSAAADDIAAAALTDTEEEEEEDEEE